MWQIVYRCCSDFVLYYRREKFGVICNMVEPAELCGLEGGNPGDFDRFSFLVRVIIEDVSSARKLGRKQLINYNCSYGGIFCLLGFRLYLLSLPYAFLPCPPPSKAKRCRKISAKLQTTHFLVKSLRDPHEAFPFFYLEMSR